MIENAERNMSNDKKAFLGRPAKGAKRSDGDEESTDSGEDLKTSKFKSRKEQTKDGFTKKKHGRKKTKRKLRARERRARYVEEFVSDSSEDEMEVRKFDVEEKLHCDRFSAQNYQCVKELNGSDITLEYFQRNGFEIPILIKQNTNNALGMKIPSKTFTVDDVKQLVGSRRIVDVMNVETQMADTMTMKEWCTYYNTPERDRLLNVISLEFSHTKLENHVDSPKFVKQMDWVDLVWPKHLKKAQKEGTNALHEMKYPKVQKYCLMSVKGCYTDFHIDFGGTSVWYHILRGGKVFWLIPPTERNMQLYEQWTLSGKQSDIFFGDTVEQCARVVLEEGNTFLIPTGWIHAVYTLEDSLVFGGNFLHSFGIEKQLRVAQVEDLTKVPNKFRYPFYTELLWYVLVRYVHCLSGKNYLSVDDDGNSLIAKDENMDENNIKEEIKKESSNLTDTEIKRDPYDTETEDEDEEEIQRQLNGLNRKKCLKPVKPFLSFLPSNTKVHLSKFELSGLRAIIQWLTQLSPSKRMVPDLVISADNLLYEMRQLLDEHSEDDHNQSITNKPVLFWISKKNNFLLMQNRHIKPNSSSSNYNSVHTKITLPGALKRPKSPLSAAGSSGPKYLVSSGTTLNTDLIPSSFEGLIAQTGLKTGGFQPFQPYNRFPTVVNVSTNMTKTSDSTSSSTINSHTTTTTNSVTNAEEHKPPVSPLVKPSSPAYPPPPSPSYPPPPVQGMGHQSQLNGVYYNHPVYPQQQQQQLHTTLNQGSMNIDRGSNQPSSMYLQNNYLNNQYSPIRPYSHSTMISTSESSMPSHKTPPVVRGESAIAPRPQQLPIRPVPTTPTPVQMSSASALHSPSNVQQISQSQPSNLQPVIVRPTYTVGAQHQPQIFSYQTYQQPNLYGYSTNQQQPPQVNGQYYQYYAQSTLPRPLASQQHGHTIPSTISNVNPPTTQPHAVYYNQQLSSQHIRTTTVSPVPVTIIQPQYSYPVGQPRVLYNTTPPQFRVTPTTTMYSQPIVQQQIHSQPQQIHKNAPSPYYIAGSAPASHSHIPIIHQSTISQPIAVSLQNQTYLMTQQPQVPPYSQSQAVPVVSHHQSYHSQSPQSSHVSTVPIANISSYPSQIGNGYPSSVMAQSPITSNYIQYGR